MTNLVSQVAALRRRTRGMEDTLNEIGEGGGGEKEGEGEKKVQRQPGKKKWTPGYFPFHREVSLSPELGRAPPQRGMGAPGSPWVRLGTERRSSRTPHSELPFRAVLAAGGPKPPAGEFAPLSAVTFVLRSGRRAAAGRQCARAGGAGAGAGRAEGPGTAPCRPGPLHPGTTELASCRGTTLPRPSEIQARAPEEI
jgi:hypothetical protein